MTRARSDGPEKSARRGAYLKVLGAAVLLTALVGLCAWAAFPEAFRDGYEDVSFALFPSAALAFSYGEYHFNASSPSHYDIGRAEYFFQKAASLDPETPYVYHQLARIAFLEGNFNQALALIDTQINLHGDSEPAAYYVRGLIEGYMGEYTAAAADYAHFLQFDPTNWAAENDEAWVLLKAKRYQEALQVTESGLQRFPENPWLLNSEATALYQLGDDDQALVAIQDAAADVQAITPQDWEIAYPGNDPSIAAEGLASFQEAIADNVHTIRLSVASGTVQSK